ncbi:MAG: Alpha-L-arabinofuranosidase domain [Frankiales bacterium]|jgi:hypothetical protein|nr:Alpha-L-arabinofuranosidase domain [Frankiales bacterium]
MFAHACPVMVRPVRTTGLAAGAAIALTAGTGAANGSCVSFGSMNYPGDFLRHSNFVLYRPGCRGQGSTE